ncbi:MAG: PRC-barrel domain-containing protein [Candidatus Caldarchaeum sp.]
MSSIPRGKLIGMQVYNPDGTLVGTVSDIELPVGGGEISLQVMSKFNIVERIPWSMVGAAGDIVILKEKVELKQPEAPPAVPYTPPAAPTTGQQPRGGLLSSVASKLPIGRKEKAVCPTCGKELTWIEQYQRWYCYNCGKYP